MSCLELFPENLLCFPKQYLLDLSNLQLAVQYYSTFAKNALLLTSSHINNDYLFHYIHYTVVRKECLLQTVILATALDYVL